MALDFKDAEVIARDPGNQDLTGKVASKSVHLGLFASTASAQWAADRFLKVEGFTVAVGSFPANRKVFKLQPGDCFIMNYAPYGISGRVWRVLRLEEESPDSERIVVHCVEDVWYLSSQAVMPIVQGLAEARDFEVDPLQYVSVVEAPYVIQDDEEIAVIPLAGRESLTEVGYQFLKSNDGSSYGQLGLCSTFQVHGVVAEVYPEDTFDIDDSVGLLIDFDNTDVAQIESISRADMLMGHNSALVGTEIISFQTITPVSGTQYRLTGVCRGRWDTKRQTQPINEHFWFIGIGRFKTFTDASFVSGATRWFKSNPYSARYSADVVDAIAMSLSISGRAKAPYCPANFACGGQSHYPQYTSDIVLTWSPRVRGSGAGYGDADSVVDAAASWEGFFEVEVFAGGALVRTTDAINDDTWTYTSTMSNSDNGCLPKEVLFKLRNYRDVDGVRYYSPDAQLKVYNLSGCDLGSATTTSTTTTTSTSSSTSSTASSTSSSSSTVSTTSTSSSTSTTASTTTTSSSSTTTTA